MKKGNKLQSTALRTALAKLKDKRIEKREDLTREEEIKVLQSLVKQRKESIALYLQGNRQELAENEEKEILVYEYYLPKMLSPEEIKVLVEKIIKDVGATSMSDMGKIMPVLMKEGAGRVDGKLAQHFVKEILG